MSAKRINVSITDELATRAEKWKGKYSASELYQRALDEFVSRKEQLAERVKGESEDMEQVIERLKSQKKQAENDFFSEGQEEGADWAKTTDYLELKYAAERFDPFEMSYQKSSDIRSDWLFGNDVLGEYFSSINEERPDLFKEDQWDSISSEAEKFLKGWLEAVRAFWAEVSPQLNS